MAKNLAYGKEGRKKMLEGVNDMANAIKATMGAKGRNVIIGNLYGNTPKSTKDGVSVAREIVFKDMVKDMGAVLIKDVAIRTSETSGDGTTCASVLAQSIINLGVKQIDKGANPMDIKKGIDLAVSQVVKYVQSVSLKVDSDHGSIKNVASISANNNDEIGQLIADAIRQTGNEGEIIVEPSNSYDTTVEKVDGLQIAKGFLSPHFINQAGKAKCQLDNPYILFFDRKITAIREIMPLLEQTNKEGRELLIFCDDLADEALATIVMNKNRGALKICAVKLPEFGIKRKQVMDDVAIITGGTFITEDMGIKLDRVKIPMLGQCDKVIIDKDKTLIVGGKGNPEKIGELAVNLKSQIEEAGDNDKQFLKNRLSKVLNGVAILKIGGVTEIAIKEKSDLIDDALQATKSAIEEGIVSGGGSTFLKAVDCIKYPIDSSRDFKKGMDIIKVAITQPFRQILTNAGVSAKRPLFSDSPIDRYIHEVQNVVYGYGYNVKTEKVENLLASGIIDPCKVLRCSLENAASVATTFLLTEVVISELV